MKNWVITFMVLLPLWSFGQEVSIGLSIHWKKSANVFMGDSVSIYPELMVSYSNMSENKHYFKKVVDATLGYPRTITGTMMNYGHGRPSREVLAKTHGNYSNEKMIVCMNDWHQSWTSALEVFEGHTYELAVVRGEEYCVDYINDELSQIYDYLLRRETSHSGFNDSFLSDNEAERMKDSMGVVIMENKERFVFLDAYETKIDTINLSAFAECGGEYLFELLSDTLSQFLPVYEKGTYIQSPMPQWVDGYELYHGKVFTNKVAIKLGRIKHKFIDNQNVDK